MGDVIQFREQASVAVQHFQQQALTQLRDYSTVMSHLVGRLNTAAGLEMPSGSISLESVAMNRSYSTVRDGVAAYAEALNRLSYRAQQLRRDSRRAFTILNQCEKGLLARLKDLEKSRMKAQHTPGLMDAYNHNMPGTYQKETAFRMLTLSELAYTCETDRNWKDKVRAMGFVDATYIDDPPGIVAWRVAEDGTPQIVISMMGSKSDYDWVMNGHIMPTTEGIHLGYNTLAKRFLKELKKVKLTGMEGSPRIGHLMERARQGEQVSFLLTGHSKGGAEAQVLTYKMMQQGIPADSVAAYTYGSPKPFLQYMGNGDIKQQANVYNHINPRDPVTWVGVAGPVGLPGLLTGPPSNIGTNITLSDAGWQNAHSLSTYEAAMGGGVSSTGRYHSPSSSRF